MPGTDSYLRSRFTSSQVKKGQSTLSEECKRRLSPFFSRVGDGALSFEPMGSYALWRDNHKLSRSVEKLNFRSAPASKNMNPADRI